MWFWIVLSYFLEPAFIETATKSRWREIRENENWKSKNQVESQLWITYSFINSINLFKHL